MKMLPVKFSDAQTLKIKDVANHSYGTITLNNGGLNENTIIIQKNTPLPCVQADQFFTIEDNQEGVNGEITQGEGDDPDYVNVIETIILDLPSGRPAGQPIKVTYSYDENQLMHCKIVDINSGNTVESSIEIQSGESSSDNNNSKNPLDDFLVD